MKLNIKLNKTKYKKKYEKTNFNEKCINGINGKKSHASEWIRFADMNIITFYFIRNTKCSTATYKSRITKIVSGVLWQGQRFYFFYMHLTSHIVGFSFYFIFLVYILRLTDDICTYKKMVMFGIAFNASTLSLREMFNFFFVLFHIIMCSRGGPIFCDEKWTTPGKYTIFGWEYLTGLWGLPNLSFPFLLIGINSIKFLESDTSKTRVWKRFAIESQRPTSEILLRSNFWIFRPQQLKNF